MNILITGGASGLGEAITKAVALAYPDEKIYFTYCSSQRNAAAINAEYPNTVALKCDFRNQQDVDALCSLIESTGMGILVNNAITGLLKQHFHKIEKKEFAGSFAENVFPVVAITSSFIASARKVKAGKIITILSSSVVNAPPTGWSLYTAEKNYLLAMHRSWAIENASFNISSNCISPGFMHTQLNHETDERIIEDMIAKHPLKKLLTPEEVASVVLFLMNASSQVNGNNIIINSSLSIG